MKTIIAIMLHKLGFQFKATTFIDGKTIMYGYGKLDGWIGIWQFNLPCWYVKKHIEK